MPDTQITLKRYLKLFLPSSISTVFCVFLAGLDIVLNQFDSIKRFLRLPQNLNLMHVIAGWASDLLNKTIGVARTDVLVVGLFWAAVGLVVYAFLRGVARFIIQIDDDVVARHYVWPKGTDRMQPLRRLAEQAGFSLVAFIVLILVATGPLATVLRGPVFVGYLGSNKLLQYLVWLVISIIMWHIVTVLLRLVTQRARIFG